MAIVQIGYMAPVEVVVDTDAGTVDRVVVVDEAVSLDRDDMAKDGKSIHYADYSDVTDGAVRARALEIADAGDAEWPAWEFGW